METNKELVKRVLQMKKKEFPYHRPAYQHMIEDYLFDQDRVNLDFDNWLWLDFQKKECHYGAMAGIFDEPATVWEYVAFYRNFYIYNVASCTFAELKKFVNFDGRRKKNRIYGLIKLNDRSQFMQYLHFKKTVQRVYEIEDLRRDPRIIYYRNTVDFLKNQLEIAEKRLKSFQK